MKRAFVGWSGGKDCTLALHKIIGEGICEPAYLLTTLSAETKRVSMHGVRRELITRQEFSLGIRGRKVYLPADTSHETYNRYMHHECLLMKQRGIGYGVFGDIFLEDLKRYREEKLAEAGIEGVFPLWQTASRKVYEEFTGLGYKAIIICVDEQKMGREFLGRTLDEQLLAELPAGVDPCGENGEFHTFAYEGPLFRQPIQFSTGETVYKTYDSPQGGGKAGFYFLDLVPM
jgi:uncharacterized protein (TIGR00290 family)